MSYFGYAEGDEKRTGVVTFYTLAQDTDWPEQIWNAARALKEGDISELLQVEDSFYLIKRLGDVPAGAVARTVRFIVSKRDFSETPVATMTVRPAGQADAMTYRRTIAVYDGKIGQIAKTVTARPGEPLVAFIASSPRRFVASSSRRPWRPAPRRWREPSPEARHPCRDAAPGKAEKVRVRGG